MHILSFRRFREEFFNAGLGAYFSPEGLRAVYGILHNPYNDGAESCEINPGAICRRCSELPRADADPYDILASVPGDRVIVRD